MNSTLQPTEIYLECLSLARQTPCQKLGFGAVLIEDDIQAPRARAYNKKIGPLAEFVCTEKCIRFDIQSRTQSMIGACGHAEERCLWTATKHGLTEMSKSELYVQGVEIPSMNPLTKTAATFTCIRCATQMDYAGVRGINVWFMDEWHFIPTDEAVRQAMMYATMELEVDSK